MAKIFDIKNAIHVTTTWKEGTPKDNIPDDYEGIWSRPHPREDGPKWGLSYQLINPTMGARARMGASMSKLEPNKKTTTGIHSHKNRESTYIILEGDGTMHLNGTEYPVKANNVIFIPPGETHAMISTGKNGIKFINVWADLETTT